jgi:uncharacterized protein (DUF1810 family)
VRTRRAFNPTAEQRGNVEAITCVWQTILGSPDDMKFRSCATLFALATGERDNPFQRAIEQWCDGRPDDRTLALIRGDDN